MIGAGCVAGPGRSRWMQKRPVGMELPGREYPLSETGINPGVISWPVSVLIVTIFRALVPAQVVHLGAGVSMFRPGRAMPAPAVSRHVLGPRTEVIPAVPVFPGDSILAACPRACPPWRHGMSRRGRAHCERHPSHPLPIPLLTLTACPRACPLWRKGLLQREQVHRERHPPHPLPIPLPTSGH